MSKMEWASANTLVYTDTQLLEGFKSNEKACSGLLQCIGKVDPRVSHFFFSIQSEQYGRELDGREVAEARQFLNELYANNAVFIRVRAVSVTRQTISTFLLEHRQYLTGKSQATTQVIFKHGPIGLEDLVEDNEDVVASSDPADVRRAFATQTMFNALPLVKK